MDNGNVVVCIVAILQRWGGYCVLQHCLIARMAAFAGRMRGLS